MHTDNGPVGGDAIATGTFSGTASADGVKIRVAVENFLIISDFVDGGGPTAQAALDSLGESTAFSSFPYPGATATALPGLVSTLTGKSLPSYPFIVNSEYPSKPTRTVTQPGLRLHAESSPTDSSAATEGGVILTTGSEAGSFANANVQRTADGFVSHADVRTDLSIAGLRLTGVAASAEVNYGSDGKATKTSSLEVASLSIAGLKIAVTDQGLVLGGLTIPLNALSAVSQAISSNGVTVKFLPSSTTEDSVMSAGLEISYSQPIPQLGGAVAVISVTLGRVFAQASASGLGPGFPINPIISPVPPLAPPTTGTPGGSSTLPTVALPSASIAPVRLPTLGSYAPGPSVGPVPAQAEAAPLITQLHMASSRPLPRLSVYPILALVAALMVAGAFGMRRVSKIGI